MLFMFALIFVVVRTAQCTNQLQDAKSIIEVISSINRKLNYALQELSLIQRPIRYPSGKKVCSVKRFYPEHGLAFVGYGYNNASPSRLYIATSLEECMHKCVEYRSQNGKSWNGLSYTVRRGRTQLGTCLCVKNDNGIDDPDNDHLHYEFL